jgi:hypothetical protein
MVAIKGHFDGKVIVPDVPVDLPTGRRFTFHVDPHESLSPGPMGVPGASLLRFAGTISIEDLDAMTQAIEQGCERTDFNEW